jgi:hypothetical protein
MNLLNTIKGTALNKDKARVWVESSKLANYGFTRHAPITITLHTHNFSGIGYRGITIKLDDAGSRKVAGRERNGKSIQILDICFPIAQREAMFNGAEKLNVHIDHGIIVITAA